MKKPVILLLPGQAYDNQFHGRAYVLYKTYVAAIVAAGGLPILAADPSQYENYLAISDGLVVTGAQDYAPISGLLYSGEHKERNQWELPLIRAFAAAKKPIFGICHGHQILNLAFGGTLKARFKYEDGVEHMGVAHRITAKEGSLLHRLYGKEFSVNSLHNTKVDRLAEGLVATAFSPDGIVEALEHESLPIYGFQWHPEKLRGDFPYPPDGPDTTALFREFIRMCQN